MASSSSVPYQQFNEDLVIPSVLNLPRPLVTELYSLVVAGVVAWSEQV